MAHRTDGGREHVGEEDRQQQENTGALDHSQHVGYPAGRELDAGRVSSAIRRPSKEVAQEPQRNQQYHGREIETSHGGSALRIGARAGSVTP